MTRNIDVALDLEGLYKTTELVIRARCVGIIDKDNQIFAAMTAHFFFTYLTRMRTVRYPISTKPQRIGSVTMTEVTLKDY